jgi:hypothetical protein
MNSTWKRALRRLCLVGWLCLAQAPAGASGDAPAPYLYQGADRLHKLVEGARREGSVPVTTPLDPQDPGPLVVAAAAFAPHRQYVAHRFNFLTIACMQHPTGKRGRGAGQQRRGQHAAPVRVPADRSGHRPGWGGQVEPLWRVVSQKTNGQSGLK